MTRTPHLTSDGAACCWIPLFPLRCETARQPELASLPVALVGPDDTRRVWQLSPLARRAGVKPAMTVSQAIGLCPTLKLCEPDPVHYDAQFSRLLAALGRVSPVIEPVELGRAFVGTDGLERLYGSVEQIIEAIKRGTGNAECGTVEESSLACSAFPLPPSAFRVGWGHGGSSCAGSTGWWGGGCAARAGGDGGCRWCGRAGGSSTARPGWWRRRSRARRRIGSAWRHCSRRSSSGRRPPARWSGWWSS